MHSDPRCAVLVAILVTVLAEAAFAAPSAESAADNVSVAAPAVDRWRGSGIDSDFDGDGYADLAVGAQDWSQLDEELSFPGTVTIMYGSRDGLTHRRTQTLTSDDVGTEPASEGFGGALAPGDFNGDGYADLAIGDDLGTTGLTGEVWVVHGSPSGLTTLGSQKWSQDSPGIGGVDESGDNFGSTLVAADFGRGDQDDLVVGASGEDGGAGAITVLYGTSRGLSATGTQYFTQATPGIPGKRAGLEAFGDTLAAADLGRTGHADLVVGVWGDVVAGAEEAGSLNVLYGSASGLTATGAQLWNQRSRGIAGRPVAADRFAFALAAGDFDGDGTADIAVGAPDNGSSGLVHVLYGSKRGLSSSGAQTLSRRTRGLANRQRIASIGDTLAAGNFGRDGRGGPYTDLAVQGWLRVGEQEASQAAVIVIAGGKSGLRPKASRAWTLDSPGIKGKTSEGGTETGGSMAVGDFGKNRDGRRLDDLAFGEGMSSGHEHPGVNVLYGSTKGLTARGDQRWTAPDLGQPALEEFGRVLGAR
jgi:hypothetical protein